VADRRPVVVDTNIWVFADKLIDELTSLAEIDCQEACFTYIMAFEREGHLLVCDIGYTIIGEYRRNIKQGGLSQAMLNRLETRPRETHLLEVVISYDEAGYAEFPFDLTTLDRSDRKFVAVALVAGNPTPPIVNASDTDWDIASDELRAHGLSIEELCPNYIRAHR
jgi:hypothetical protein